MPYSVDELSRQLGLPHHGDGSRRVCKVSGWDNADDLSLVFIEHAPTAERPLPDVTAACVVAPPWCIPSGWNAIVSETPKLDFARAAKLLHPRPTANGSRHPTATISPEAVVDPDVEVGQFTSIGAGARVGSGSILKARVEVGDGCVLGQQCTLHPGVVLYPGAILGDRVELHAGVVVGSDGFGYVRHDSAQLKFPQVGSVLIESDVEIGANTTVDRGALGTTRICEGAKIDNLVQIAHNVQIGRGVVIAAQTGVAGSTVIEDHVVIGGQVGFGDHARVEKGAVIGSKAGVLPGKIVRGGDVYWGVPVRPLREYKRLNALFGRLPLMKQEMDALRKAVARLTQKLRELQDGRD